jgi:toxin YoeB
MRKIVFATTALQDLQSFKSGNQKLAFRIFELIADIQSEPFKGGGEPEPLKGNYKGFWSRRINDEHRLIYTVNDHFIEIHSSYGYYDQ